MIKFILGQIKLIRGLILVIILRESEFKANLFISILQGTSNIIIVAIFWMSLSGRDGNVYGWSLPELVVLGAFMSLFQTFASALVGLREMSSAVISGEIDKYFVKPLSPLTGILVENCYIVLAWNHLLCGLVALIIVFSKFQLKFSLINTMHSLAFLTVGSVCWGLIYGCAGLFPLVLGKATGLCFCLDQFSVLYKFPVQMFASTRLDKVIQLLMIGYFASYPSAAFLGKMSLEEILKTYSWGISCALIWFLTFKALSLVLFRHYESYGG
ncbi:MAG: ABC-2 family transporter protein [Candidatus Hodarchaeota archaeon]